jgi:hypothetical protein
MSKAKPQKKNRLLKVLAPVVIIIVVLAGALYLARGWVRNTVEPAYTDLLYAHDVQGKLDEQARTLHDPMQTLGYTHINKKTAVCHRTIANGIRTAIDCEASYQAYGPITANKAQLQQNAAALQAKLQQGGWSGNPVMSLKQFIDGITAGADNQPDATYIKNFGKITCTLSTTTAFKSPNTPAMNTQFVCNRDPMLFGDPWDGLSYGSDGSSSAPY